jgi:hypothetical protein
MCEKLKTNTQQDFFGLQKIQAKKKLREASLGFRFLQKEQHVFYSFRSST